MANHYSQATVSPYVPSGCVTDFEKILLGAYGFDSTQYGSDDDPKVYFYVPEGERDSVEDFDSELIKKYASQGDEIAQALHRYLIENGADELDQFISSQYHWVSLFQHILNKPECRIDEIVIEGCYYCDKLRQGEFGGWISRITKFTEQHGGTQAMLIRMCQESAFLEALTTVYQLASANCADNAYDPNDPLLEECLAEDCRKQRAALNVIHKYCANHELNQCDFNFSK